MEEEVHGVGILRRIDGEKKEWDFIYNVSRQDTRRKNTPRELTAMTT